MRSSAVTALIGLVFAAGALCANAQTVQATRSAFEKGEMQNAIEAADRTLNRTDAPLAAKDQYDMMMLKAEALLQLKRMAPAQRQFAVAALAAPDLDSAATANANALLLARAPSTKYTPKAGPSTQPIDVVDRNSRKQALLALARDMVVPIQRNVEVAMSATTVPPVENAFQEVFDFYSLKVAAGENADDAKALMDQIGDKTRSLMRTELDRVLRNVGAMERISDSYDNFSGARRGLSSPEKIELRQVGDYLQRMHDRMITYRRLALRLGGKPETWDSMLAETVDLQYRVDATLRFGTGK